MVVAQELVHFRWPLAKVGAAILVVGGLALPLALLPHYIFKRTHVPLATGLEQACGLLGRDAAIVVVQSRVVFDGPQYRYPQALQSFCDVPVATAPPGLSSDFYRGLAAEWQQQGRRLQLVANLPQALGVVPGDAHVLQQSSYQVLERTFKSRPTKYLHKELILFFKPVPASA
jgi:hypothetical protein